MSEAIFWSDENRQRATNGVYHSIEMLEKLAEGWIPDPWETPETIKQQRQEAYDSNLKFLKLALNHEYYEGFLDKERVQAAIDVAESNPLS